MDNNIDNEIHEKMIKITNQYEEEYSKFIRDTDAESPLQIILRAHLYIEHELRTILSRNIMYPEIIEDKLKFSELMRVVFALGLVPKEEMPGIIYINKLRNQFAHNLKFALEDEIVNKLIDSLSPRLKKQFDKFKSNTTIEKLRDILFIVWSDLISFNLITKDVKEYLGMKDFE